MAALNDLGAGWLARVLPTDLRGSFAAWRDEFRANPKLLGGAAIIGLLAWGGVVGGLQDHISESRQRLDAVAERYQRTRGTALEADWAQRRGEAEALRQTVEGRLWPRQTEGLATASIQDWVIRAATEAGLNVVELRAARPAPVPDIPDLSMVEVRLAAPFLSPALEQFLSAVARAERALVVRSMHVQQEPDPRIEITLLAYVPTDRAAETRSEERPQ